MYCSCGSAPIEAKLCFLSDILSMSQWTLTTESLILSIVRCRKFLTLVERKLLEITPLKTSRVWAWAPLLRYDGDQPSARDLTVEMGWNSTSGLCFRSWDISNTGNSLFSRERGIVQLARGHGYPLMCSRNAWGLSFPHTHTYVCSHFGQDEMLSHHWNKFFDRFHPRRESPSSYCKIHTIDSTLSFGVMCCNNWRTRRFHRTFHTVGCDRFISRFAWHVLFRGFLNALHYVCTGICPDLCICSRCW